MFGSSSLSFHIVNVFLHCWLVNRFFKFLRLLGHSLVISTVSALLFGLHPVNSESVANCVGRAEILSAHFFLSAVKNRNDSLSSGAFAFLAMMCKEGGIFCLAVLVGIEVFGLLRARRGVSVTTFFSDEFWMFVTSKLMLWMGYLFIFISLRLWILNGTYPIFTPHDNPGTHPRVARPVRYISRFIKELMRQQNLDVMVPSHTTGLSTTGCYSAPRVWRMTGRLAPSHC